MMSSYRSAALLLMLACHSLAATAEVSMVERFDAAVASMPPAGSPTSPQQPRTRRSAADFVVERRLSIELDFPGDVHGTMYGGLFHGEAAIFTRSGDHLDTTVLRNGDSEVISFGVPTDGIAPGHAVPRLTSVTYGDAHALDTFERVLKALDDNLGFDIERTYKKKYVLLTARRHGIQRGQPTRHSLLHDAWPGHARATENDGCARV